MNDMTPISINKDAEISFGDVSSTRSKIFIRSDVKQNTIESLSISGSNFERSELAQKMIKFYMDKDCPVQGNQRINSLLYDLKEQDPSSSWTLSKLQGQIPFISDSEIQVELIETIESFLRNTLTDHMMLDSHSSTLLEERESQSIKSTLGTFFSKNISGKISGFIEANEQNRLAKEAKQQEIERLISHEGYTEGPNSLKQDLHALRDYYQKNPGKARTDFRKAQRKIEKLKGKMKVHYSGPRLNQYGRESLNRLLLTEDQFKKALHDPVVIKGILAMEALDDQRDVDAGKVNKDGLYQMTVASVLSYGVEMTPANLALVTPNSMKADARPEDYRSQDSSRRKNVLKLQEAFSKARASVAKDSPAIEAQVYLSRFDRGYDTAHWQRGLGEEFAFFKTALGAKSLLDLKGYVGPRRDLANWTEELGGSGKMRAVVETEAGIQQLIAGALRGTGKSIEDLSKEELIENLAQSDSWLDPYVSHMCLDRLHFGSVMMLGDALQFKTAEGNISGAELFEAIAAYISKQGVTPNTTIAAEALFSRMALVKDYTVENCAWEDFVDITEEIPYVDEIVYKKFLAMKIQLNNRINSIESNNRRFSKEGDRFISDNTEKEEYARLIVLKKALETDANELLLKIEKYQNDPMFQFVGTLKFLSFLKKSDTNLEMDLEAKNFGLTDLERVAIYGYTTADYTVINPALRGAGAGEIANPRLRAYAQYAVDGLRKLPDLPARDPETNEPLVLRRAIFTEPSSGWCARTFVLNGLYRDYAFMSTSKVIGQGFANLKFTFVDGKPTHAKNVKAFSAWPGENEFLLMPGVEFTVTEEALREGPSGGGWVTLTPVS